MTLPEPTQLLLESAEHWLDNWANPSTAKIYSKHCPLCKVYLLPNPSDISNRCRCCPIREFTGRSFCHGTPWQDCYFAENSEFFRAAAANMYRFLVCLALGDLDEADALCNEDQDD